MVLGPLVVLGGVELTLRLAGYGYPTSFFVSTRIEGRDFYVPNGSLQPPVLPVRRWPVRFCRSGCLSRKPANTYRIFLFGESAANGDPDPSYGVGRYLKELLRERYPGTDFEVVCVAITAIDSNVILRIARECAQRQGDLWLIYMGNNEMVGPFGAETVFGPRAPNRSWVAATLAVKATRLGQLLNALAEQLKGSSSAHKSWGGMQMFIETGAAT